MSWFITADTEEFLAVAGEYLRAEPARNSVVLYTDLANPTSNALYQRLGYRPVEDRVVFSFEPAHRRLGFTRERTRRLRGAGRW
jgi:RimJ/RimL family protein N-acetyltransferase